MKKLKKLKVVYHPQLLNANLFKNLKKLERSAKKIFKGGYIPLPYLNQNICANFSIKRDELREILETLQESGLVTISRIGIKLNFEVQE